MKKILTLILASASIMAIADEDGSGLYVGAGVGAGWNTMAAPATTFRLNGGYNFNQNWAIELGTTGLTQSGAAYNQNYEYYDLSVKGTLPLSQTFDIYAQVGGAYGVPGLIAGSVPTQNVFGVNVPNVQSGVYQSSWGFVTGVGFDYNFTKHVAMNLSDLYYYGPSAGLAGNTNVLLLGVKYNI